MTRLNQLWAEYDAGTRSATSLLSDSAVSADNPKVFHLAHLRYIFSSESRAYIRLILSIIQVQNIAFFVLLECIKLAMHVTY